MKTDWNFYAPFFTGKYAVIEWSSWSRGWWRYCRCQRSWHHHFQTQRGSGGYCQGRKCLPTHCPKVHNKSCLSVNTFFNPRMISRGGVGQQIWKPQVTPVGIMPVKPTQPGQVFTHTSLAAPKQVSHYRFTLYFCLHPIWEEKNGKSYFQCSRSVVTPPSYWESFVFIKHLFVSPKLLFCEAAKIKHKYECPASTSSAAEWKWVPQFFPNPTPLTASRSSTTCPLKHKEMTKNREVEWLSRWVV